MLYYDPLDQSLRGGGITFSTGRAHIGRLTYKFPSPQRQTSCPQTLSKTKDRFDYQELNKGKSRADAKLRGPRPRTYVKNAVVHGEVLWLQLASTSDIALWRGDAESCRIELTLSANQP